MVEPQRIHRCGSAVVSALLVGHLLVAEAEVMAQLVKHGLADLPHGLLAAGA
jgi:hypothetical protein